jgi:hypothetical protein
MKQRIEQILDKVKMAMEREGSYSYLPEIAQSLEAMKKGLILSRERRSKMAGALERIVTEDFIFSESPLGEEILKLSGDFAEF